MLSRQELIILSESLTLVFDWLAVRLEYTADAVVSYESELPIALNFFQQLNTYLQDYLGRCEHKE
jgi:hypothetical protein